MRRLIALPALALLLSSPARAAGEQIDCSNANNTVEMNFCADKDFAVADAELNTVYKAALAEIAKSTGQKPYDAKSWEAALRASQRAWVAFRDADCKELEPMKWGGGTITTVNVLGCMTGHTQERTKALKERFFEAEAGPARVP
jgi:uncharacterized protein YecT (DUF1311 family)